MVMYVVCFLSFVMSVFRSLLRYVFIYYVIHFCVSVVPSFYMYVVRYVFISFGRPLCGSLVLPVVI